jgi:hypothetical protein
VGESIQEAPRTLQPPPGAALREYQMVGLQWMVSLYNNHLNGILADEMVGFRIESRPVILSDIRCLNDASLHPHIAGIAGNMRLKWLQLWCLTKWWRRLSAPWNGI